MIGLSAIKDRPPQLSTVTDAGSVKNRKGQGAFA